MGRERKQPGRRRARDIEYYVVVEGAPSPEVLVQNYLWCLKQRALETKIPAESGL